MSQIKTFVGLDVHKDSIAVALADHLSPEVRQYGIIPGELHALDSVIKKLFKGGKELHFVYEAGPCGFHIYRYLKRKGFPCIVVSPTHVPKNKSDRIKTDRRDAATLARLHRSGDLHGIYVPEAEDEAIRDLIRARDDAMDDQRRNRHRLKAFLLRNGIKYAGRTSWTAAHMRWLSEMKMLFPSQQIAFEEYLHAITDACERVSRLTLSIERSVEDWRLKPVVQAYQVFRGIKMLTAVTLVAELGDLTRFDNARQLMSYVGLVPSEHSSGGSRNLGGITKTGNRYARRALVESAWSYRLPARVTRHIRTRIENHPKELQKISWQAQMRLCAKFRRLGAKGKNSKVVTTAIARELLGFVKHICHEVYPKCPHPKAPPIRISNTGVLKE